MINIKPKKKHIKKRKRVANKISDIMENEEKMRK